MSTTLIVSLLLGGAALVTSAWGIYTQVKDRSRSIVKQEGAIKLDDTTRTRLAAEAAQINSDARIATERWWKEQFDAVKTELVEEQRSRRRLAKWAREHQEWDQRAWTLALETDPLYPAPPQLDGND